MKKLVLAALFAAALPLALAATTPATPKPKKHPATAAMKLPSTVTKIEMLGDLNYSYKPGAGSQLANSYWLTCHSSAYVSTQPPLDQEHWTAEVGKMRKVYGATIPDADAEKIADYLAQNYGR
ncbi:MAG: hypothetical protein NVS3B28_26950 [Candidatus Velthaea sp.]